LKRQFDSKKIITPYEFGIYDDGLATKIKSNNYVEEQQGFRYSTPIFMDQNGLEAVMNWLSLFQKRINMFFFNH